MTTTTAREWTADLRPPILMASAMADQATRVPPVVRPLTSRVGRWLISITSNYDNDNLLKINYCTINLHPPTHSLYVPQTLRILFPLSLPAGLLTILHSLYVPPPAGLLSIYPPLSVCPPRPCTYCFRSLCPQASYPPLSLCAPRPCAYFRSRPQASSSAFRSAVVYVGIHVL